MCSDLWIQAANSFTGGGTPTPRSRRDDSPRRDTPPVPVRRVVMDTSSPKLDQPKPEDDRPDADADAGKVSSGFGGGDGQHQQDNVGSPVKFRGQDRPHRFDRAPDVGEPCDPPARGGEEGLAGGKDDSRGGFRRREDSRESRERERERRDSREEVDRPREGDRPPQGDRPGDGNRRSPPWWEKKEMERKQAREAREARGMGRGRGGFRGRMEREGGGGGPMLRPRGWRPPQQHEVRHHHTTAHITSLAVRT